MKKRIIPLIIALGITMTYIPSVLAVNYSDYIGSYYTLNSDAPGYAALDIYTCDSSSITLDFKRIKNDAETYTYTFDTGTVGGENAVIPFHATITSSGSSFDGVMTLEFYNGMIKINLVSNLGSNLYNGMLPKVDRSYIQTDNTPAVPSVTQVPETTPSQQEPASASPIVRVNMNGTDMGFNDDTKPFIQEGHTYVPLRSVFYEMGINVYWDEYQKNDILKEQLITCTKNSTIIQFSRTVNDTGANVWTLRKWTDSDTSQSNYENIDIIDQQPIIINESSYLPLRVISESLGAYVDWVDLTKTVVISCDTANTNWFDKDTISSMEDFAQTDAQSAIPADYSEIVPVLTPFYSPGGKFYLFNAADMYGNVKLTVHYGNYIDVSPNTDEATVNESSYEQPTETPAEVPTDPTAESSPTVAPTEESSKVFHFDMRAPESPTEDPSEISVEE